MEDMLDSVKISSEKGAEMFVQEWLPECSDIIDKHRDQVENWMPDEDQVWGAAQFNIISNTFVIIVIVMTAQLGERLTQTRKSCLDKTCTYYMLFNYDVYIIVSHWQVRVSYWPIVVNVSQLFRQPRTSGCSEL